MGVLYAKVGGTFVPIAQSGPQGPSGGPVPVGGAVGDVIIKNGAADFAVRWGTDLPKLKFTPGNVVGLDLNNPGLQIGEANSQNLVGYWSGLMSRNNGAAAVLRLNYYGGQVIAGGGDAAQYPTALAVGDSAHATSRRAGIALGSGWQFLQDLNGNGAKDFGIYQTANARTALAIAADAATINLMTGVSGARVNVGSAGAAILAIGDDAYFQDLNIANGLAIRGVANANAGWLAFGNNSARLGWGGSEFTFQAAAPATFTASRFNVLNAAGDTWFFNHDGTRFWVPQAIQSDSNISAGGDITAGGEIYTGVNKWVRARGTGGFYFQDYGVGWTGLASQWMQTYSSTAVQFNNVISMMGQPIRLYANKDDNNHRLQYYGGTPPGSGEASNGPMLYGYGTVYLATVLGGQFFLASGGSVFINAGKSYLTFSSREMKENVIALDPNECLDQVRRWRPVEFDLIADGTHADGFIAEDHVEVTPSMVHVCEPDSQRPGWANAVAYEMATPRLAGAIQALVARIEQLERNAA